MATYVNDLRLTELATGEGSGTWGTTTNLNLELIGEALGYGTQDCFASDADATTTVADGATDPARAMYFKVTSSATLTATRTLTIAPNTMTRVMLIENATTGSQSIAISQGSGGNVTIATGQVKMVYLDGAGAGAAVVDALASLELGTITVANLTATTADINGGTIDGATIGGASAAAGTFTTLNATGGGALTGTWSDLGTVTTVDINGGTIDGATIGGASAGAGTFTNLTASGTVSFSGATVSDGGTVTTVNIDGGSIDGTIIGAASPAAGSFTTGQFDTSLNVDGTVTADGLTVDTNTLHVDATNNRVGIGTTSPSYKLDLKTTGSPSVRVRSDDAGGTATLLLESANTFSGTSQAYIKGIGTAASGLSQLSFGTAGSSGDTSATERMRIDSSGNVGIGTTSTGGYKFDVAGTARADSLSFRSDGSAPSGDAAIFRPAAGSIALATNSTERMRIDSSGNVGIGTTSPSQKMHINASSGSVFLQVSSGSSDGYLGYDSVSGYQTLQSDTGLFFATGASFVERMRIDSSGNLLVGATSNAQTSGIIHGEDTDSTVLGAYAKGTTSSAIGYYCKLDSANALYAYWNCNGVNTGTISTNGTTTSYNISSDYRLKDVDGPITNSGAYIDALKPVQGSWKADGSRFIGLIAHEVQEVSETQIATGEKDGEEMQGMDYSAPELIANLIAEIQSLRARVAQLEGA